MAPKVAGLCFIEREAGRVEVPGGETAFHFKIVIDFPRRKKHEVTI